MSCRDYDHYIQLYVDQEISESDRRKLLEHTRTCTECRRELKEMVALVSSMEDVRQDIRTGAPVMFRGFFKWVAVCTVAVSFAYLVIPLSQHNLFTRSTGDPTAQPLQHSIMVLAAQEEPMTIPNDETVQIIHPGKLSEEGFKSEATLVYPSAVSYFLEKDRTWSDYTDRFVFIHVPDEQTLVNLLTYAGAKVDRISGLTKLEYPTSVMVSLEEGVEYEPITFPDKRRDIRDFLDSITSHATVSEPQVQ